MRFLLYHPSKDIEYTLVYLSLEFEGETQAPHINLGVVGISIKAMRLKKDNRVSEYGK